MSLGVFGELTGTGNNYAIGGARTGTGGALGGLLDQLVPTGVLTQVNHYLSGNTADPFGTYFLLGGGNDLRDAAALMDSSAMFTNTATSALNMISAVYSLYQAGARNFVLLNAPNIGLIPESPSAGRFESGTLASMYFNYFLGTWAAQLGSLSGINLEYVDVFSFYKALLSDVFQGGAQYGYTSITPCINNQASCSSTIFFDDIHPTAGMHGLLAEQVLNQIAPPARLMSSALSLEVEAVPEPSTGFVLLGGLAGIAMWKRFARNR